MNERLYPHTYFSVVLCTDEIDRKVSVGVYLLQMKNVYKYKSATWVDLVEPSADEIQEVVDKFGIDPLVANEVASPSIKHMAESKRDHLFLILYFPLISEGRDLKTSQEIDFIIGKDFLVTVRYEQIDSLERFAKEIEVEGILGHNSPLSPRDLIFFGLLEEMARGLFNQLSYVDEWLKEIEKRIFSGKEKEMVFSLSEVSRYLIDFKKISLPYVETMESLEESGRKLFGEDFGFYAERLTEELSKCEDTVKNQLEMVFELRETNNSMLSTKQNEIMKVLTIMAFVTFPLSLIAAIFGMNTAHFPIVGNPYDFWIVLGMMGGLTVIFFIWFKYKKWL
jgi:magnesium transporter